MPVENESDESLIAELWQEHLAAPFPRGFRGKGVDGIDFVMLDADVAGCAVSYLERGNLDLYQTARLGLAYRNAAHVLPILNEVGVAHFWRLERTAELILRLVAKKNEKQHNNPLDSALH